MTAAELMQPRYEVIADFPCSSTKVGNIILGEWAYVVQIEEDSSKAYLKEYPHLFRKLNWWEYRKAEDMPKKVICRVIPGDTEVITVQEWDMGYMIGWVDKSERSCCDLRCFAPEYGYFPVD